ncbi:MAG: HD domain-containing protein [Deltaproteobacteria bacterium]|nr:HD domain-containing protein [Deltaproteobacteria bacterium]
MLKFDLEDSVKKLFLDIVDTVWFQRLRDVSQTGCCRYVFPFLENSRFGHSLHTCYLMCKSLEKLRPKLQLYGFEGELTDALILASLLHDIGHLAPGSHLAWSLWFPDEVDEHEKVGLTIIENSCIQDKLQRFNRILPLVRELFTREEGNLPNFCYELLSGEGWNVDRGSWIYSDSILSAVTAGLYNIDSIIECLDITEDGNLCFHSKRATAMLHFLVSRYTMYTQVYNHPKALACEENLKKIINFIRTEMKEDIFMDDTMQKFITAKTWTELSMRDIFFNTESWFRYHLMKWSENENQIIRDLVERVLSRNFFSHRKIKVENLDYVLIKARTLCESQGLNPEWFLSYQAPKKFSLGGLETFLPCEVGQTNETIELVNQVISALQQQHNYVFLFGPREILSKLDEKTT